MIVFALLISYDYAGDELHGLYSTRELAETAYAEMCESSGFRWGDSYHVAEVQLDAAAVTVAY